MSSSVVLQFHEESQKHIASDVGITLEDKKETTTGLECDSLTLSGHIILPILKQPHCLLICFQVQFKELTF